jgi:Spy/CpxP family protein refolding chaperone
MAKVAISLGMIVVAFLVMPACFAQSHSPYAGFETRSIKALSDQQIRELRSGLGMSLALAAELNGYPGPRHAIELAKELDLNAEQRNRVEALFAAMTAESIALGEKLIAQEADLDRQFATKTITATSLMALVREIGSTHATLRATHLKYHLATLEVLTPAQAQRYAELRGYSGPAVHDPGRHRSQPDAK